MSDLQLQRLSLGCPILFSSRNFRLYQYCSSACFEVGLGQKLRSCMIADPSAPVNTPVAGPLDVPSEYAADFYSACQTTRGEGPAQR